jgi:hypothetical protein
VSWGALGDRVAREGLARDPTVGTDAELLFAKYGRAPDTQFSTTLMQPDWATPDLAASA